MRITPETSPEEIKKATLKGVHGIPVEKVVYVEGKRDSGNDEAFRFFLQRVCRNDIPKDGNAPNN